MSIPTAPSQPKSPSRYRLPVKTRSSTAPDEEKYDWTSPFQEPWANTLGQIDRDRSVSTPTNSTGNRSGDQGDQEDQRCRQESSEDPPGRHTEPDQTGTEDARQDGTDRGCQHDAVGDLAEFRFAAIEHRLRDEDYPNVEDDQPGEEQDESAPIERRIDPFVDQAAGTLDWWVKERQEWFGRVRGKDGCQRWVKATDLHPSQEGK